MAPELRVHLNSNGSRTSRTSTNLDNTGALTFRLAGNRKQSRELVRFDKSAALLWLGEDAVFVESGAELRAVIESR